MNRLGRCALYTEPLKMFAYSDFASVQIVYIAKNVEKRQKTGFLQVEYSIVAFERVDLGSEKCQAVFSGQKRSKRYQLGRCALPAEVLRGRKSFKLATM